MDTKYALFADQRFRSYCDIFNSLQSGRFFLKIVQFVRALSSDVRNSMRASLPHVIRDEKEEENFQRLSPAPLHVLTLAPDLSV